MADSARFRKEHHIRRGADFRRAYDRRCRAGDAVLLIYACENGLPHPRLGLSVSRKVGPAVVRNRWKRVIRESFRLSLGQLPAGVDLVVIPRKDAPATLAAVQPSLRQLAGRLARRLRPPDAQKQQAPSISAEPQGTGGKP